MGRRGCGAEGACDSMLEDVSISPPDGSKVYGAIDTLALLERLEEEDLIGRLDEAVLFRRQRPALS